MTLYLCTASGEWSADHCPADCPATHHIYVPVVDDPAEIICGLLNTMRSAFDELVSGNTGEAMDDLKEAYQAISMEEIGY